MHVGLVGGGGRGTPHRDPTHRALLPLGERRRPSAAEITVHLGWVGVGRGGEGMGRGGQGWGEGWD